MNFGNKSNQPSTARIKKQDSYLQAIGNTEDELTPLPKRASVRKQESYQRAMMAEELAHSLKVKLDFLPDRSRLFHKSQIAIFFG